MTSPAVFSSSARLSLRLFSDFDSRETPSNVGPSCGAIWSSVCASVSSDWLSDSVLVPAVLLVSSFTASVSEYGDDVREIGMTELGDSVPEPADSSASTRSPSRVPVRMCAVVSLPSAYLPLMVKPTSASPLSSLTDDTEPTLMPDTVTSLPIAIPPASENSAWYRSAVAHCTMRSGCNPTATTRIARTTPMMPALMREFPRYFCIYSSLHLPASCLIHGKTTVLP